MVDGARGRGVNGDGDGDGDGLVRYTGLVVAIDAYLESVMSWDKSEAARRLGVANAGDGDGDGGGDGGGGGGSVISDNASERLKPASAAIGSRSEELRQQQRQGRLSEARVGFSQQQQQQLLPVRSAKKTIRVGDNSPNSVARAARGWDNDTPVVAPGMRHYPQRTPAMAALVGNGGFDGRTGDATVAAATPSPRHPMSSAHTTPRSAHSGYGDGSAMTASARAGNLAESRGGERGPIIYDIRGAAASPSEYRRYEFVPAGGRSGLDKPEGSSGRRGSVGRSLALSGDGVSRSLVDAASAPAEAGCGNNGGGHSADASAASAGVRGASSPGIFGDDGGEEDSPLSALSRRRQSNTGQLRNLVEAWPEEVAAASPARERRGGGDGSNGSSGSNGSDASSHGDASPGRYGSSRYERSSPGSCGGLKSGLERR